MNNSRTLEGGGSLQGIIEVPGDKSISHRALILGSIAEGQTTISGFLNSEDPISTANCLRNLGVKITDIIDGETKRPRWVGKCPKRRFSYTVALRQPMNILWDTFSNASPRWKAGYVPRGKR